MNKKKRRTAHGQGCWRLSMMPSSLLCGVDSALGGKGTQPGSDSVGGKKTDTAVL